LTLLNFNIVSRYPHRIWGYEPAPEEQDEDLDF